MKTLLGNILFASVAFMALSAEECGETHYISDSGFDLWCEDSLCDWNVLSGRVARAASWHRSDYAVEMIGTDVLITQLSTRSSTDCLRFEVLADIEDDARVTLAIDFFDDGVVDYEQELGHVRWESLVHFVSTPASWQGVRFSLHKEGPGRARLAQIEATADTECIDKPIEFANKPLGAFCLVGSECQSAMCETSAVETGWFNLVCSSCAGDTDCEPGLVCGAASEVRPFLLPERTCVPKAARDLGLLCVSGAECSSGVCCDNQCAQCCSSDDCGGAACEPAILEASLSSFAPNLCIGGDVGAPCLGDTDCVSASCAGSGELKVCAADGRDCSADDDCPGVADALDAKCLAIGIAAGTCQ